MSLKNKNVNYKERDFKDTVYLQSADGKVQYYGLPPMHTIKQTIEFLEQFPENAYMTFLEENNYAGALHMICHDVSVVQHAGPTTAIPVEEYVVFHLKAPFSTTVAAKAGSTKSNAKSKAARENGKKGGRPKK